MQKRNKTKEKEAIKDLLAELKIKDALAKMKTLVLEDDNKEQLNNFILLQSNLKTIDKKRRNGVIDIDQENKQINTVIRNLLELLDEVNTAEPTLREEVEKLKLEVIKNENEIQNLLTKSVDLENEKERLTNELKNHKAKRVDLNEKEKQLNEILLQQEKNKGQISKFKEQNQDLKDEIEQLKEYKELFRKQNQKVLSLEKELSLYKNNEENLFSHIKKLPKTGYIMLTVLGLLSVYSIYTFLQQKELPDTQQVKELESRFDELEQKHNNLLLGIEKVSQIDSLVSADEIPEALNEVEKGLDLNSENSTLTNLLTEKKKEAEGKLPFDNSSKNLEFEKFNLKNKVYQFKYKYKRKYTRNGTVAISHSISKDVVTVSLKVNWNPQNKYNYRRDQNYNRMIISPYYLKIFGNSISRTTKDYDYTKINRTTDELIVKFKIKNNSLAEQGNIELNLGYYYGTGMNFKRVIQFTDEYSHPFQIKIPYEVK